MTPIHICHVPSGSSTNQLLHFGQQIKYGFFGRRMKHWKIPNNFPLYRITAPISLHYSTVDSFTNPRDMYQLILLLNNTSDLYVHVIDSGQFNHVDFVWGLHATDIVYKKIVEFFAKH